jgi:hypothetical protein
MKTLVTLFITTFLTVSAFAQGGHGRNREYRDVFHYLLQNHTQIEREVTMLENGVSTNTFSNDQRIAAHIKKHVHQMKGLVESGRRIRNWDPLFSAIFDHYELIEMNVNETNNGIEVIETSHDPFVASLIKQHAEVVSLFVKHGFAEAHRSHPVKR